MLLGLQYKNDYLRDTNTHIFLKLKEYLYSLTHMEIKFFAIVKEFFF